VRRRALLEIQLIGPFDLMSLLSSGFGWKCDCDDA